MGTVTKRLLATVVAASTILGMSSLPALAAEDNPTSSSDTVNISDVNATAETRALFAKLRDSKAGDLRFGQQHATDEHISSTASEGDVYEMTGKYPAVFGWDAGLALRGAEKPGSGSDKQANAKVLAQNIVDADAKGAIVTLSAHWYNPGTGGDFNDTTAVASELLPGGKYSGTFNEELDAIAATAQQAKRSDGTLIPIIFRPLHENNGSWFWWGATHASASEYKELYRYIVDYLRDVKGVHNLLYAYSPGGTFNGKADGYLETYPGDQWVDVLGYDEYDTDNSADDSNAWINTVVKDLKMIGNEATNRGKIVAFTEFGRSGDRKFTESGTDNKDTKFFAELADALAKEVPNTAYMMTWANFGGSGSGFQSYTPWKGTDGEKDFQDFANSNANLMASADNVDYSNAPAAAAQTGSARIVTPVNGNRVTDTKLTIRVKTEGVRYSQLDTASAVVTTDRGQSVKLTYSCNGYFTGTLDLDEAGIKLDQSKLTLTAQVKTKDGKTLAAAEDDGSVTVRLGAKPEAVVGDVETFDTYDSDAELQSVYSPNHTEKSKLTLTDGLEGSKAGNFHYVFANDSDYNGFQRSYTPKQDWSGFSKLTMKLKADGSDHKFVVQINAGGVTFEAYPKIDTTDTHEVTLNFGDADGNGGDFAPASWDTSHAGTKLSQELLSKVGSFALYINSNGGDRPTSGDLVIDSIRLDGERDAYAPQETPSTPSDAEPQSVDDFSGYADDQELRSAWGNRNHTEVLSLTDGPTDGSKALRFTYDFANGGWYDVAQYLGGKNWSGEGTLKLQVRGDGSNNAIGLQIGTMEGKYFHYDIKLDFEGWKQIEIPLVGNGSLTQTWPDDADKGNSMTDDDLTSIKELVFASNKWNDESTGIDFAIADIQVVPSDGPSTDTEATKDATDGDTKQDEAGDDVKDTSADIANQDPSTCPIADDPSDTADTGNTGNDGNDGNDGSGNGTSADPSAQSGKKTSDAAKSAAKKTASENLSSTGSGIVYVVAAMAVLLLGGCAAFIVLKRKGEAGQR